MPFIATITGMLPNEAVVQGLNAAHGPLPPGTRNYLSVPRHACLLLEWVPDCILPLKITGTQSLLGECPTYIEKV